MFGRKRPVKVGPILYKIVLKCAKECLILTYKYNPESMIMPSHPANHSILEGYSHIKTYGEVSLKWVTFQMRTPDNLKNGPIF